MSKLTTDEFIELYDQSPKEAMEWITANTEHFLTLFTTRDEVGRLSQIYEQKLEKFTWDVRSGRDLSSYLTEESRQERKEVSTPVGTLLNHSGARLAALYETNEQFTVLCSQSQMVAGQLFKKDPDRIAALFATVPQFFQLLESYQAMAELVYAQAPERIESWFGTHAQFMQLYDKNASFAKKLFKNIPEKISALFVTHAQFMQLLDKDLFFPREIFQCQPARIGSLFATHAQFMQLRDKEHLLAKKVFENEPARISSLFVTHDQFMKLRDKEHLLAEKVFENEPARIGSLFATYDQFMKLRDKDYSLANRLFDSDPNRIAVLFNTQQKFARLKDRDWSLSEKVAKARATLNLQFEVEVPVQRCQTVFEPSAPPLYHNEYESGNWTDSDTDYAIIPSLYDEESGTMGQWRNEVNRPISSFGARTVERKPPETNHNFHLKCLAGLALVGGVVAIIGAVMLVQPDLLELGVIVTCVATISLIGLFSNKSDNAVNKLPDFSANIERNSFDFT